VEQCRITGGLFYKSKLQRLHYILYGKVISKSHF
jgi:hypothetical protein